MLHNSLSTQSGWLGWQEQDEWARAECLVDIRPVGHQEGRSAYKGIDYLPKYVVTICRPIRVCWGARFRAGFHSHQVATRDEPLWNEGCVLSSCTVVGETGIGKAQVGNIQIDCSTSLSDGRYHNKEQDLTEPILKLSLAP